MSSLNMNLQSAQPHLRALGYIYLILGILGLGGSAWFGYLVYGPGSSLFTPEVQQMMVDSGYGTIFLGVFVVSSIASIITGIGLIKGRGWARAFLWFFSIIGLLDFPIGTILSIYAIWALTRPEGEVIIKKAVR